MVARALAEDVGSGDVTAALIPEQAIARGEVVTREDATLCGSAWFDEVFHQLDARVDVAWEVCPLVTTDVGDQSSSNRGSVASHTDQFDARAILLRKSIKEL